MEEYPSQSVTLASVVKELRRSIMKAFVMDSQTLTQFVAQNRRFRERINAEDTTTLHLYCDIQMLQKEIQTLKQGETSIQSQSKATTILLPKATPTPKETPIKQQPTKTKKSYDQTTITIGDSESGSKSSSESAGSESEQEPEEHKSLDPYLYDDGIEQTTSSLTVKNFEKQSTATPTTSSSSPKTPKRKSKTPEKSKVASSILK